MELLNLILFLTGPLLLVMIVYLKSVKSPHSLPKGDAEEFQPRYSKSIEGSGISGIGNINGQNYSPLEAFVAPDGILFKTVGIKLYIPYEALRATTKKVCFFVIFNINYGCFFVDPNFRDYGECLQQLSRGKFMHQ